MQPLVLEKITVREGRMELLVHVTHARYVKTSPALLDACMTRHPFLADHACKNPQGTTFGAVMNATSTPHLLEHLIIDIQTQNASSTEGDAYFVGTTQFLAHDALRATVSISYYDDLACLSACKQAVTELNALLQDTFDPAC